MSLLRSAERRSLGVSRSPLRSCIQSTARVARRSRVGIVLAFLLTSSKTGHATPTVWAEDDGTRISPSTSRSEPELRRKSNIELFALRNETIAFQIVIRSGGLPLDDVTVNVLPPSTGSHEPLDESWVDRFVVHSIQAIEPTRNGWLNHDETLAWATSGARAPDAPLWIPDALIPIDDAPAWATYPLRIEPQRTACVWIDVHVPDDARQGSYGAQIVVRGRGRTIATLPLRLEIKNAQLPFKAVQTAVFYDPAMLERRIGEGSAELRLWHLFHRHHLTPMLSAKEPQDIRRIRYAIDGSIFRREHGYTGPGQSKGNDVIALGAYGALGEPSRSALARLHALTTELALLPRAPVSFLYAIDERCESDRAARWRKLLRSSGDPLLHALRVGESCHLFPAGRAADLILIPSTAFRAEEAYEARSAGKWLWVYNGQRPRSGPLMLDASPLDLRINGWIAAAFDVDRWFYWESTFWGDSNSGGRGPVDPFATADSFHNSAGDIALGDGLLVYPGRQLDFPAHSVGIDDVFPSIRLKNLRRGIQDAGYVALVARHDPALADRIVRSVLPRALDEVSDLHNPTSWSDDSAPLLAGRRALWEAIPPHLELDDDTVRQSLAAVAAFRRERVDRSPEEPASRFTVAMLAGAAGAWALRRFCPYR